ncbi:MAG: Hsp20 family protein [Parvularculales bacterium]
MSYFDFSPLYRSTVGFDRLAPFFDTLTKGDDNSGYPPYNIERTGENDYRITMAVAGFEDEDLTVEAKQNELLITGKREQDEQTTYLYHGIAGRSFERRFQLADHVNVTGAHLSNGLLYVELVREIPEEMRSRRIHISNGSNTDKAIIQAGADAA